MAPAVLRSLHRRAPWLVLGLVLFIASPGMAQFPVPSVDEPAPGQVFNAAVHPFSMNGTTEVTHKVPLLEVFTATWCPPCNPSHGAIERLMAEQSPGLGQGNNSTDPVDLALLSYHPFPDVGGEDPFGIPEGHNRLTMKHNAFWFPSAYVDGVLEDAPQTRSMAVDVGMEETLYNSYRNLVSSARVNDPPFLLIVESERVERAPATWEVTVRLEATRTIETPLLMQGVLWEDHVLYPGSNGVDRHRMVVRDMAPVAHQPGPLGPGDVWEETVRLVAPPALDPAKAGATVIIEAEWGTERDERAGLFFSFAVLVAGGSAVVAAWQMNTKKRSRQKGRSAGGSLVGPVDDRSVDDDPGEDKPGEDDAAGRSPSRGPAAVDEEGKTE